MEICMMDLKDVTICVVDTVSYGDAVNAIQKSLKQVTPARTIMFTDIDLKLPAIDVVQINHIHTKEEYSKWMMKELGKQDIQTSHILICQHDGFVLNGECWEEEF